MLHGGNICGHSVHLDMFHGGNICGHYIFCVYFVFSADEADFPGFWCSVFDHENPGFQLFVLDGVALYHAIP